MKKRFFSLLLAALLMIGLVAGKVDAEEVDYQEIYKPVLDDIVECIISKGENVGQYGDLSGIREVSMYLDAVPAADSMGYTIQDISGDGIPELLIADISSRDEESCYGSSLYAMFTYKDGAPLLSLEGWARNQFAIMPDGTIFNRGSGGATYAIYATYAITPDGSMFEPLDYFFTHERNGDFEDIAVYHNNTGEWDVDASEEMEFDLDLLWQLIEDDQAQIQDLELTALSDYGKEKLGSYVFVQWLADVSEPPKNAAEIMLRTNDEANRVLFTAFGSVTDLKLLELTLLDISENGTASFETKEVYAQDQLNKPLIAGLNFYGTIPNCGFSYVGSDGITKTYSIEISGYDGSIILTEINA